MIDNKLGQQSHDRATRGLPLSEEERAQLETWYSEWDEIEEAMLSRSYPLPAMAEAQQRIDEAWASIPGMLQRIQDLRQRNEQLRAENEALVTEQK
jgi:hypothetical protein